MFTVTQRANSVKQPKHGYLPVNCFSKTFVNDEKFLSRIENVPPCFIGLAVDYLTRFVIGEDKLDVFHISIKGIRRAEYMTKIDIYDRIKVKWLDNITGNNQLSVICALKLVTFDSWGRNLKGSYDEWKESGEYYFKSHNIKPDDATINNIMIMVQRSVDFWKKYGPIKKQGFTFQGGYTLTVLTGDGDFMTEDTLWEFKTSKYEPKSEHTLQLLMYWVMGMHSIHPEYKKIKKLGIFNPRLNVVYLYNLSKLSDEVIKAVEDDVICYDEFTAGYLDTNFKSILDM